MLCDICKSMVTYISELPEAIRDQMPEFGRGLLALDDEKINMVYPQYALAPPAPGGIAKVHLQVPVHNIFELQPVPGGITAIRDNKWFVHVNRDAFNYACVHKDLVAAQTISEKANLGRFQDNTRSDHIHWAAQFANRQTVHNIAEKELDTINSFNSFLKNSLMYAINRWVVAQEEASKTEAKYVIAEIVVHGGRVEGLSVVNPHDDAYGIGVDVQDIIDNAAEILSAFSAHAALAGDEALGLQGLDLAA